MIERNERMDYNGFMLLAVKVTQSYMNSTYRGHDHANE